MVLASPSGGQDVEPDPAELIADALQVYVCLNLILEGRSNSDARLLTFFSSFPTGSSCLQSSTAERRTHHVPGAILA